MTEQQYTCPYCHKNYTRFTISEHYGCGVEPLETIEDIKRELDAISEEVAEQEAGKSNEEQPSGNPEAESKAPETEALGVAPKQEPAELPQPTKPAPKKRGPKPKAKVGK